MKNYELEWVLSNINGAMAPLRIKGLRNESLPLKVKLRLHAISDVLGQEYKNYIELRNNRIKEVFENGLTAEEADEFEKSKNVAYLNLVEELKTFDSEPVGVTFEKLKITDLDSLVSEFDYSPVVLLIAE